ncbi:restriction endonuclease subunit S [Lacticaseibacillus paracasei]|uniref:restriction endonuclease subunit S n=1 Tax=Lacticaseibacillus paracasei TaxID=1597 RepID=UPI000176AD88|nr:restriction endonuclease subunit S [Lacticaseibacillus paracasei]CAQ67340.1 Type I R/M system specificity subunit [Lacticaseibacillus paracasei]
MSKDARNVPALRFKGYSDAWEKRKLGEIFNVVTDYVANGSFKSLRQRVSTYSNPNFAYMIRLQDASNNWKGPWLYTDQQSYSFLAKTKLNPGDILMSNVGSVGKFFLVPDLDRPMTLAPNAILLRSMTYSTYFLFQLLQTSSMTESINEKTTPGVQQKINKTDLKKIITNVPTLNESSMVGQMLSLLDNLIAATQDKLSFLKKMKMFFLQQIFPTKNHDVPQIRFDGFTDVWSHYKLGSLMRIDKEQEVKKELLTDIQKGFYVLAMRTFSMDGYIDHSKPYWLNHLDNVSDDKFLLPREFAILDADMDANLPKIGRVLLNASSEKYLLAAHVRKIQVKSGNDPIFIYALMRGNSVHERLKLEANGSISKRLLDKNVYKQSILVPNRSEQSRIGRLFFLLETTITLHQQKIKMLKQVKKSCLQNLFI